MRKGILLSFLIFTSFLQISCDQLSFSNNKLEQAINHMLLSNPVCKVVELKSDNGTPSPLTAFFLRQNLILSNEIDASQVESNAAQPFKVVMKGISYLKWLGGYNYAFCLPAPRFETIGMVSEPTANALANGKKTVDVVYSYTFPNLPDWAKEKEFEGLIDDDNFRLSRFIREDGMPIHGSVCMEVTDDGYKPLLDKNGNPRETCH